MVLDCAFHFLEHRQRLDFVFDQRRALSVSPQIYSLAQHVHVVQVFHPFVVDDSKHDDLFQLAHDFFREHCLALLVSVLRQFFQVLFEFVAAEFFQFRNLQCSDGRENFFRVFNQLVKLPLFGIKFFVRVLIHFLLDYVIDHAANVVTQIFSAQNFFPLAVQNLALLIHHVIILKDVLANVKVARLNFFLRVFNRPRYQRVLNRLVLFHAEFVHDFGDIFRGEQSHQVIFQRNVKPRLARVTLTATAPAQLIVDSPRLVTLRADYEQPAEFGDAFAEFDIRAAPRHVRGNRHDSALTRVRHDLRFLLVELGVEDAVRDAALPEVTAELFGLFNRRGADEDGLTFGVNALDLVGDGSILRALVLVNDVGVVCAAHGFVRGNDDDGQLVNF